MKSPSLPPLYSVICSQYSRDNPLSTLAYIASLHYQPPNCIYRVSSFYLKCLFQKQSKRRVTNLGNYQSGFHTYQFKKGILQNLDLIQQRYRDRKIRVCGKDLVLFANIFCSFLVLVCICSTSCFVSSWKQVAAELCQIFF